MRGVASLVAWLREPIQPGLQRAFTVWCSDAVAHSLDKIIALERAALREYADLRERLQAFETRYQLSSEDFYRRFRAGEMGDAMDVVEWSVFYEMWESVRARLALLESA
jgi:hypothetical protein